MTYPLTDDEIRRHNAELIEHLPHGPMRGSLTEQAESTPVRAFEMLVSYYAQPEDQRQRIRAMFYGLDAGETVSPHAPTSGELAEQMGAVAVPPLPEHLVALCRNRLMAIVHEHSQAEDVNEDEVAAALMGMGLVEADVDEEDPPIAGIDQELYCGMDEDEDEDEDEDDTWGAQWRPSADQT